MPARLPWWPRSLFGRLTLILCFGLIAAHGLSFGLILYERAQSGKTMMLYSLGKDVASSVAILERVPAAERATWLGKLERRNYHYVLGPVAEGAPVRLPLATEVIASIGAALDTSYTVTTTAVPAAGRKQLDIHLRLADGTPLTIVLSPSAMPVSPWVPLIISVQLGMLTLFMWLAVRLATRPLAQLARAADLMTPDMKINPLPEDGPLEVARAAAAFNAMQRRIADFLNERMQILAAVSHDLQTPITRMRLRADLMDNSLQRDKMLGDLLAMQALVEEGIAYARNAQGITEAPCRTDLDALLGSLVYDYIDAGHALRLSGQVNRPLMTRPHALRRIITNLVDNALKFGEDVEIQVAAAPLGQISIAVLDRGPGIRQSELHAVLQPFYRIENSRNRETGGAGLGLAIAQQLAVALGGVLKLSNRDGGGLQAQFSLPLAD
ncbi:ATP-binding protein [Collimonas pratensis]|uniref:ATP-binding protein n=1 Tax=Collimonas pratensis TaxID=279113 RepID=UPI0007848437|nr:ATP-binding protein [Collimonas pratensis]